MSYKTGFYEGRLGIGLSSTMGMGDGNPRYPLDINGDIRLTGSIVDGNGQVLSLVPAEKSNWTIGNNNLSFTGGNVGIGTASPQSHLHLAGTGDVVLRLQADTDNSGEGDNPMIEFRQDGNLLTGLIGTGNLPTGGGVNDNALYIQHCGSTGIVFLSGPSQYTQTTSVERMRITPSGDVGIGTTSPGSKLDILGLTATSDTFEDRMLRLSFSTGYAESKHGIEWYCTNINGGLGAIRLEVGNNYLTPSMSFFIAGSDAGEKMRITNTGNVGIGTTEPSEKLDIDGNMNILGKIKGKIYKDTGVGPGDGSMGYNSGGKTIHFDGSYTYTRGNLDSVHDINGLGIPFPEWKNDTIYRVTFEVKSSVAGSVRYSGGSGMWTTYKTFAVSTEYQTYIFYVNGSTFKPTGFKNYHADMTVRQLKIEELVDNVLQLENPVINETLRIEPEPTGAAIVEIPDQLNSNSAINASHRYGGHFHYINTEKHKGLYVIGGYDGNTKHTIHRYDIDEGMFTSSWENVQFSPSGTTFGSYYGASIVYNGDVIIHGGDGHGTYKSGVYKLDFHVDYPTSTEIHDGAGTAPSGRNGHSAFLHQNRYMYIYGGRGGAHTYYSDMWRFDLTNNTWSEVSQNNTGEGPGNSQVYTATIWKDRYIVLLGGRTNSSGGYVDTENIYLYDLLNNRWQKERLSFFDDTVYNLFATTSSLLWSRWPQIVGNCLIIYGGYINSGAGMGCVWSINLLDFRLRILKKSAAHMRYHIPVTKVGNDIYAFGGYSNGNYQTVLKIRLSNAASIVNTINPGYGLTRNRVEQNGRDRMFISDTFRTYSWRQAYLYAQSKGGKLPTMSYIRNNYEFLYRGSVDKWTAVFDDVNHRPDWVQIGSSNHPYGKSHTMEGGGYPSWGDGDNTSHAFRDTIIVVFQDDIMLNNTLIVKADGNIGIGQADTLNGSLYRISFGATQRYYSENAGVGYSTAICFHENNSGGGNYFYGIGLSRPTSGHEGIGIHGGTEGEIMRHDNANIVCRRGNDNRVGISTHGAQLNASWATCYIGNGLNTCCYVKGYYYSSNTGQTGFLYSNGASQTGGTSANIGLFVQYAIYSAGNIYAASDRRIKKNIVDVPDDKALENIRNIPCRYYDYKDERRGGDKTIGFIAQEVREVFPMAVTLVSEFLPNIQKSIEFVFEKISEEEFKMTTNDLPLIDAKFRFICSNNVDEGEEPIVREYDLKRNEDGSFIFSREYDNIFCYGYEVDDFHIVDKQKLFALNFSATQELDRKVIALEEGNNELKNKVETLLSKDEKIETLESKVEELTKENREQNVKILDLYKENEILKARLEKIQAYLGI